MTQEEFTAGLRALASRSLRMPLVERGIAIGRYVLSAIDQGFVSQKEALRLWEHSTNKTQMTLRRYLTIARGYPQFETIREEAFAAHRRNAGTPAPKEKLNLGEIAAVLNGAPWPAAGAKVDRKRKPAEPVQPKPVEPTKPHPAEIELRTVKEELDRYKKLLEDDPIDAMFGVPERQFDPARATKILAQIDQDDPIARLHAMRMFIRELRMTKTRLVGAYELSEVGSKASAKVTELRKQNADLKRQIKGLQSQLASEQRRAFRSAA